MSMNYFKDKKNIISLFSFFVLFFILPLVIHSADVLQGRGTAADYNMIGQTYLVHCDGSDSNPCDFNAFVDLINRIINWIISIAGVIFTISLIWGGYLYMTSGENPGNKDKAKGILWNTLKGFVIILVSWLIVYTILNTLVPTGSDYRGSIFRFIGNGN